MYFYGKRPPLSKISIPCVVYFYSERPQLPKIFCSMRGLFLWRETVALQRSVARDFGGVSQIKLHVFSFRQDMRKGYIVYHKKVSDYASLTVMITLSFRFLNIAIFKTFVTLGIQTNWSTCDEWIEIFGFYTPCLRYKTCHVSACFICLVVICE